MKKVLSVVLAIMMALSCMAVSVSAADDYPYFGTNGASTDQAVLKFRLNGGTVKSSQYVYNEKTGTASWVAAEEVPNVFAIVPIQEYKNMYKENDIITLPSVKAPKGYSFVGWQRMPSTKPGDTDKGIYSTAPGQYKITSIDTGIVVEFNAVYEQGEVEEDTFAKVFEILAKIFGTIIGLIAYNGNVQAGIDFVNSIFSSISG